MIVENIKFQDPFEVFLKFSELHGTIFLDSSMQHNNLGRYSFIAIDPFKILKSKNFCQNQSSFDLLKEELNKYQNIDSIPNLPPFQCGAAGYFSYDLCHELEKIPNNATDDMLFPDMHLGFYDLIIGFDIIEKQTFIFSSGILEKNKSKQQDRAYKRLNWLKDILSKPTQQLQITNNVLSKKNIISNFSKEEYCSAVQKTIDYIFNGDIFEANLSQRFKADIGNIPTVELYNRIRKINKSTFSAYLNFGNIKILSSSPERFLKLQNGIIESRPIKGTSPRFDDPVKDIKSKLDLESSIKDRAENIMIVDLMRNDLSKVCENNSVNVPQLCRLESYATVHHLVSVVTGKLKENFNAIDLLKATFPGGSITGAPKIRAMEIIAELEPTARGPYCGSIGYIGFDGSIDTSITIRTFCINNTTVTFQAGGAIVSDSTPEEEYQETLYKAAALVRALTAA